MTQNTEASGLVSIVVPAYNHGRYLEQAVESVLNQSYPNIELIVLDDGSTDNTREVLQKYTRRFQWESQQNMGQARTLNKGWAISKGSILAYLSADDYLHPDAAAHAVEVLSRSPDTVATYCDFELVDDTSRVMGLVQAPAFNYEDMVLKGVCPPGPGAFFRRSGYEAAGGWNDSLRRMPDFDFWLRLGLKGKLVRIPQILAYYRMHDQSQSFSPVDAQGADEILGILDRLYRDPRLPADLRDAQNKGLSNGNLLSARLHLFSGRYSSGLARAASAVGLDPLALLTLRSWRLIGGGFLRRLGQKILWQARRHLNKSTHNPTDTAPPA